MEVCYWALLFMPLVILLYLYSLQIKGDSNKKQITADAFALSTKRAYVVAVNENALSCIMFLLSLKVH
jgi:hypothetical protein